MNANETNTTETAAAAPNLAGAPNRTDAQVRDVISRAVSAGCIDQDQGELIYWLHGYGQDKNLADSEIARLLKVSGGAISLLFSGKYPAKDWSGMVDKIRSLKQVEDEAAKKLNLGFVETETAKTIFAACDAAMVDGMPAFIYGASQIGKTTALLEYARRNNHGRTKYLRMGSRWSKARLVRELAIACKRKHIQKALAWQLETFICESLNRYNLLIIDEFHLAMETVSQSASREIVEYIREVFDRTHCGLVLASTKVGLSDLEEGPNRLLFDQLRRRGVVKVVLPDVPKVKDINAIARSFSLELPSGDLLRQIKQLLKSRGLGVFIKYLQKAHSIAASARRQMTWQDFAYVNNGYESLAAMRDEY